MIDPSAFKRISPYWDRALDLEPGERAAWLDELAKTDVEIARTLREFLNEHEALNAEGFLAGSALPLTHLDTLVAALEQIIRGHADSEAGGPPGNAPLLTRQANIQGRLDLCNRKLDAAHKQFELVLARNRKNETFIDAALGKAEVELLAGNTDAAVTQARIALDRSTSLHGGVPHSSNTGLSWLMLGRALKARSEIEPARKAFESALTHLSNTVAADHPDLLRARDFLRDARLPS